MRTIKTNVAGYSPVKGSPAVLEDPRVRHISGITIGRYVDILYDKWFKKILGAEGNKDVLIAILRELIPEREIVDIRYDKKNRRKVNPFVDGHDAYFDVECVDSSGVRFVVEMQKSEQVNFAERALFYSTFPIQEQVEAENKGKRRRAHDKQFDYQPVYVVSFLNFSIHEGEKVIYRYGLREQDSGESMTDRLKFIILEMGNYRREYINASDSFAEKLSFALTHMGTLAGRPPGLIEEVFSRLFEACELERLTAGEQTEYKEDTMTTKKDWENILYTAEIRGEKKGMERGMKKGMEKGMEKGRQALILTARRLVNQMGLSVEQASEATGLSPTEFLEN